MVHRPEHFGAFEFVVLAALRAGQLMRGCIPRVEVGLHKVTIIAQTEVAEGKVPDVGVRATPGADNGGRIRVL